MTRTLPYNMRLDAAAMLAREVPVVEIARQFSISRMTVYNWSRTDEAQEHIAAIRQSVREATKSLAVADKVRRISYAQAMFDGAMAVIESRRQAGVIATDALPGEATGHVAIKTETLGNGVTKREAAFDAAIHAEARKWLEYAAKELDDITSAVNVRHSGRVDHVVSRLDLSNLTDEQLESLAAIREQAIAEEVAV